MIVVWIVLGFCLLLPGCRSSITAEKLEASVEVREIGQPPPPTVEVHYDKISDGPVESKADE